MSSRSSQTNRIGAKSGICLLNKGEAAHSLARDVAYGQRGVLTDRDFASQFSRATCLSLLLNIIAAWNTRYMQAALNHLRATGYHVQESDLKHLSPIASAHINVHGSYHLDLQLPKSGKGNCAHCGLHLHCSNEAVSGLSVVDIFTFGLVQSLALYISPAGLIGRDVGMGEFRRQAAYKSRWNGEELIFADHFFPSSKLCHCYGWKWVDLALSDRVFLCQNPECRMYLVPQDRDKNASENLAQLAEEYLHSQR